MQVTGVVSSISYTGDLFMIVKEPALPADYTEFALKSFTCGKFLYIPAYLDNRAAKIKKKLLLYRQRCRGPFHRLKRNKAEVDFFDYD